MSLDASLGSVPNYLTAKSPEGLRRLMLQNNVRGGVRYVYHSIQFAGGQWWAWFYQETKASDLDVNSANNRARET